MTKASATILDAGQSADPIGGEECQRFGSGHSRRRCAAARQLLPCALLLFAACATEAKYRGYVDGFVGQSANQLYATWGAPVRAAPTPDGGQVVSFLSNVQSGRGFGGGGFGVAACETSFILDRAGTVVPARCARPATGARPATRAEL
jgi:hypothetical protein